MTQEQQIRIALIGTQRDYTWLRSCVSELPLMIERPSAPLAEGSADVVMLITQQIADFTQIPVYVIHHPVIVLTDIADEAFSAAAIEAGAHCCILKQQLTPYWLQMVVTTALLQREQTRTARQQMGHLRVLTNLAAALRQTDTLQTTMAIVLQHAVAFIGAQAGVVYLNTGDDDVLTAQASFPPGVLTTAVTMKRSEGVAGYVMRTGQPYVVVDFKADPLAVLSAAEQALVGDDVYGACVPLPAQGENVGVIQFLLPQQVIVSSEALDVLLSLAEIAGSALQRVMFTATLEKRVQARSQELAAKNEELAATNQRLQELDRLKSKFVSDVSHELRTPITSLELHLDLIERRPERREHYLARVRQEVDRLRELVLDILRLSRFDLGRMHVTFADVDFNQLITREIELYAEQAETAALQLVFDLDATLPLLTGEFSQLAEMVKNLVENAILYTRAGGVRMATAYDATVDEIVLTVKDSGLGIAAEEQEQIFSRFYRGTNAHGTVGTGLGLNLVQEIVKLHHGTVHVTSEPGKGSCFEVRLPRRRQTASERPAQRAVETDRQ